jgi:hypothetical protein
MGDPRELEWAKKPDALKESWTARIGTHMVHGVSPYINWAIFLVRFRDAVDAKGYWGHFDGSTPVPSVSTPPTAAETAAKGQWDKDE